MAVTFSHLVRKPYTVQYPDRLPAGVRVQDTLPFRYRGMLEVDLEICTACLACERACPIDCIVIDATKDKAAGGFVMTRFDIDMAKCMTKPPAADRKSTRLNSSHDQISYAVFCLKKK